jgi:hypothetical protein
MKKKLLSVLLLSFALTNNLEAQIIWNGPVITFTKAGLADYTLPANQDRITGSTWLTRANTRGLFNIFSETGYTDFVSPANTEWATGTLANYASLTYQTWENWHGSNPPSIVSVPAVVHLISENIYIGITFLSWSSGMGVGGGGFSYQRTTVGVPTPVKLASFTATKKNSALQLNWRTVSEENASSFSIERSNDGKQFTSIGTVQASGNSTSEKTYSFTDRNPLPANFYRLRTNDYNGAISYSNIVAFKFGKNKALEIFPVPAKNILHIQMDIAKQTPMELVDATGRIVRRINLSAGDNAFTIEVGDLKPGVYFLKVRTENKMFIKE